MKIKFLQKHFLILFIGIIFSGGCQLNSSEDEFPENCIDCPLPRRPPVDPEPQPEPDPTPESRYDLGYSTGQQDATYLFNSTYYSIPCRSGSNIDGELVPMDDDSFPGLCEISFFDTSGKKIVINVPCDKTAIPTSGVGNQGAVCPCWVTTESQRAAFYLFIVDYREALQAKISSGIDIQFNQGLLDGFNYQLSYIKINYCISNIPS